MCLLLIIVSESFETEFRETTRHSLRDPVSWPPLATEASSRNPGPIILPGLILLRSSVDRVMLHEDELVKFH